MTTLEKILQEIENYETEMEDSGISCLCPGWVRKIIKKHLSENDGWIPCSERMPEKPKENSEFENKKLEIYLVSIHGTKYPFRAFWNGESFTDGWTKVDVLAWRPLPDPYRRDGE